ncbi:hypothetical protein BO83DRAFT_379564 [Aspergillus eucalypticola CBS 122712]|uniref:Uncharacterized protein n=1 Tax=Aspergillus eucalypticola (strain CBS 122712 / IBT 29274) TaxID=1448314 RepID=A0A317VA68_ASPEC|nr:uncharacterized protein BO83DRAFT_379564 [Aspergillus eucalypticola CBS 122712]PWY69917.1 hypothetical protein BO83DRAFT_379564 [Aspergillus eucalypticola CBS 122712]
MLLLAEPRVAFFDRQPPVPKRAERYLKSTINLGASEERYVEGNKQSWISSRQRAHGLQCIKLRLLE